ESSKTLSDNFTNPICQLSVTNSASELISLASVGQKVTLQLEVQPNATYSAFPRNCFAVNVKTGEKHSLRNKAGCSTDYQRFPQWSRTSKSLSIATFGTFKWPDSSSVLFQCDCAVCIGECPEASELRSLGVRRKFFFVR
ncbi:hypothetical protein PENTCL1PPCAC_12238, partial [Pristionchus entomophagus]